MPITTPFISFDHGIGDICVLWIVRVSMSADPRFTEIYTLDGGMVIVEDSLNNVRTKIAEAFKGLS